MENNTQNTNNSPSAQELIQPKFEFGIGATIKGAWKACFDYLGACLGITLSVIIIAVAWFVIFLLTRPPEGASITEAPLISLALFGTLGLMYAFMWIGVSHFALNAVDKQGEFSQFFIDVFRYVKGLIIILTQMLLGGVFIIIGTVLAVNESTSVIGVIVIIASIPLSVYVFMKYGFALFAMLDKNMGIMESFAESSRVTAGLKWQILVIRIVVFVIWNIFTMITFGLGNLILYQLVALSEAYLYRASQQRNAKTSV